ncbi:MAG: DUF5667 domain-containing protein [Anaerolineae bacterium]
MKQDFELILDGCWQEIAEGRATIEACTARYPQQAGQLETFLRLAESLKSLPKPELSAPAMASIEARLLRRANELRRSRQARPQFFPFLVRAAALAMVMVLAAVLLEVGVIFTSLRSLPGSPLYEVKRTVEQIQLTFALNHAERSTLHLLFANRRLDEVTTLLQTQGRLDEGILLDMNRETEMALVEAEKSPESAALLAIILDITERQQLTLQEAQSSLPEDDRRRIALALETSRNLQAQARQEAVALQPSMPELTPTSSPTPTSLPSPTAPPAIVSTATPELTPTSSPTPTPLPSPTAPPAIVSTATPTPEPTRHPTTIAIVPATPAPEKPAILPEQRHPIAEKLALSFRSESQKVEDVQTASLGLKLMRRGAFADEAHSRSAAMLIQAKKEGILSWGEIKKLGGQPGEKGRNLGRIMSSKKKEVPPAKGPEDKTPPGQEKDKGEEKSPPGQDKDKGKGKDKGGGKKDK